MEGSRVAQEKSTTPERAQAGEAALASVWEGLDRLRVRDLMTREVATLRADDKLSVAEEIMRTARIRHIPVVREHEPELIGILSQRNLFRGALARAFGYGEDAHGQVLNRLLVKEVMSEKVVTCTPGTPVAEAAQTMLDHKIGALPVVEGGKLVGILTDSDFVTLVAHAGNSGSANA